MIAGWLRLILLPLLWAQNSEEPFVPNNRGIALLTQQSFESALTEFRRASSIDSRFVPGHINQGIALLALGRTEEARASLSRALEIDPGNVRAHYALGLVYRSEGKTPESLREFEAVLKYDSEDAFTHYFVASLHFQNRDYTRAIESYVRAIDLDPALPSAYFGAARSYTALQQPDRARIYFDRFQQLTRDSALNATVGSQYGEQGPYSLAAETDPLLDRMPPENPVRFTPVQQQWGVRFVGTSQSGAGGCILDYDADGRPDILLLGDQTPPALYRNSGTGRLRFVNVAQRAGLASLRGSTGCAAGDFDNDGFADLFAAGGLPSSLLRLTQGRFRGSATLPSGGRAATFVDLDHDGWLDLVVDRDQSLTAFRNNAGSTFRDVSADTRIAAATGSNRGIVAVDYDNDRDVDLVVTGRNSPATILSNDRTGTFTRIEIAPDDTRDSVHTVVVDFDKDSRMDLFLTRFGRAPLMLRNTPQGMRPVPLPDIGISERGAASIDFDNDGFIDVAVISQVSNQTRLSLLRNRGAAGFEDVSAKVGFNRIAVRSPDSLLASDLDGDGDVDLVVTQRNAPALILRNDGGNTNRSITVRLRGLKDNKTGLGTKVEIHGGRLRQKVEVAGGSAFLGQSDTAVVFGLGKEAAEFVRLIWPTGVIQDELIDGKTRFLVEEIDRKGSSCPTLYSWDGAKYRFITDLIGPGVIGEWVSPGVWNEPDTDEYIRLSPGDAAPVNGKYRFKVLSQMEEVTFLDAAQLIAVDTPDGVDVYPNDRYQPLKPYPPFKLWQVKSSEAPVSVRDGRGNDLRPAILSRDGQYAPVPSLPSFPGFAEKHELIIDLGELHSSQTAQLVFHGYTQYFDSTTNHSAYHSSLTPIIPSLEVSDGRGGWIPGIESIGIPAGLPKSIVVDLTGLFPTADHRVRITTNMAIYWDQILVNKTPGGAPMKLHRLIATGADLGFGGFPLELRKRPEAYDYARRSSQDTFRFHTGRYTRYGNVQTLLTEIDDMFVVMAAGDEVTVEFDAAALPELPRGWQRTLLFMADGFEKAMETYTPFSRHVAPMPFHGMSRFPYPDDEKYPDSLEHTRYQLEYNTRVIRGTDPLSPVYRRKDP